MIRICYDSEIPNSPTDRTAMDNTYQTFSNERLEVCIDEHSVKTSVQQSCDLASALDESEKIALLTRVITMIDLTSLGGNDTPSVIENLCKKALNPISTSAQGKPLHTAAVCVYPVRLNDITFNCKYEGPDHSCNISIAAVAAGFPSGQYPLKTRLQEIRYACEMGADEIDIVIDRTLAVTQKWAELYHELREMRTACQGKCMKTILASGELLTLTNVYKASMVAMMAGSDFIKTSTGKEAVNATLPVGVVMSKAIKDYYVWTQRKVGLKPAGGIKTATQALEWMVLVKTELGDEWLCKRLFRIGASSLLDDINDTLKTLQKPCH